MKLPFLIAGAALLIVVVIELVGLAYIYATVPRFHSYWEDRGEEPGELVYVALGDSTAQGVGASRAEHSYVGVIAKRLERETGKSVRVVNLSQTGARISDVLETQLPQLPSLPTLDLVTIEIGANDVSGFDALKFESDFTKLIDKLPPGTYVSDLPDFGSGPRLHDQREGAEIARRVIGGNRSVTLVPLEAYTRQHFSHWRHYSFDFFHPNNRGYTVWADAFWQEIQKEL